ncbi:ATPase, T2SS/T4P/T4SS family [Thomasclavelia ramosa]
MIGEIRDEQTARLAVTCALTGHLVLTTIHSSNCLTTIRRLLNLGLLKIDIEDVLIGIICQKMLYHKYTHQPLILPEYLNRQKILTFFNNEPVKYQTFEMNAKYLLKNNLVDYTQVAGIIYE